MNTEWLHALVVFARSPSMEIAAAELKTTQPTLTRQLKALQDELNVALFAMQGRKKVLTPAGQDLAAELAPRFAGLQNSVERALMGQATPEKLNIRIGARREILASYAAHIQFSGHLIFKFISHQEIVERLLARDLDIGISHERPDSLQIAAQPIFSDRFQLCVPTAAKTKIMAKLQNLPPKKLIAELASNMAFLAYDENFSGANSILDKVGVSPKNLRVSRTCPDWSILLNLIADGQGWSFVPYQQTKTSSHKNVQIIELPKEWQNSLQFYLIYLKELGRFPWFKELQKTKW